MRSFAAVVLVFLAAACVEPLPCPEPPLCEWTQVYERVERNETRGDRNRGERYEQTWVYVCETDETAPA